MNSFADVFNKIASGLQFKVYKLNDEDIEAFNNLTAVIKMIIREQKNDHTFQKEIETIFKLAEMM